MLLDIGKKCHRMFFNFATSLVGNFVSLVGNFISLVDNFTSLVGKSKSLTATLLSTISPIIH